MRGKIIKGIGGFYYVSARGKVYECKAKGIFRALGIRPLPGDDVEMDVLSEEDAEGNVTRILERKNELIRPAVANVDQAMIVVAKKDPKPNPGLIDRFLISMESRGVTPLICLNKLDLADEEEDLAPIYRDAGYTVFETSAEDGSGVDELKQALWGKTTVLAGPSGVGKSTLINRLYPEAGMETGEISRKIRRGRHTTRHTEWFALNEDTFLLDTPGFTSIWIEDLEPEELSAYYEEFEPFVKECRFAGCAHVGERECGVKTAVKTGKISLVRYRSYCQIYEELKDKKKY